MRRLLPAIFVLLVACTPAPRKDAMSSPGPSPSSDPNTGPSAGSAPRDTARTSTAAPPGMAARGPIPEAVSAAGIAAQPMSPADTPAAALGRRTLSTAFVRIGPDGQLTVELHGGRVVVLRDVTMGLRKYCGVEIGGGAGGKRYCGSYAEVAAARPGGR